ncbi:MAG TPA: hypothetical protein VF635_12990, partial [Propionibacteriaceae bacterium]
MKQQTKTLTSACAALTLGLTFAAVALPAAARWTFHDSSVGETITAPNGGTRAQTCADRLVAVGGWAAFMDFVQDNPATFKIPDLAKKAVAYEVWKAPPGFRNFGSAVEDSSGVYFEDSAGTRHPAV